MLYDNKINILIVDDEPFFLESLGEMLELEGYQTLRASGGYEAMEIVKAEQVDLIITDIRMPEGTGLDLLLSVRANDKGFPPIIMMSGFSLQETQDLVEKGADLVLKKPVDSEYLLNKIKDLQAA